MQAATQARPRHQRSAANDQRRLRLVFWLRILLPLAALAILSTLFLFSRPIDPSQAIPYAEVDVAERARTPRLVAPAYSGVTAQGTAVSLRAEQVTPLPTSGDVTADRVSLMLEDQDGTRTTILAEKAQVESGPGKVSMSGGVSFVTSTLYSVTTPALVAGLRETYAQSDGPVRATAPLGQLEAGSLLLEPRGMDSAGKAQHVLVFNHGVRVVYDPKP